MFLLTNWQKVVYNINNNSIGNFIKLSIVQWFIIRPYPEIQKYNADHAFCLNINV